MGNPEFVSNPGNILNEPMNYIKDRQQQDKAKPFSDSTNDRTTQSRNNECYG
jgi:hypothetical protein